jgi:hypothetical protein
MKTLIYILFGVIPALVFIYGVFFEHPILYRFSKRHRKKVDEQRRSPSAGLFPDASSEDPNDYPMW